MIILGILLIFYGIFLISKPRKALDIQHMFTLVGKREYTDWAVGWTVVGGFITIVFGIALMFGLMIP